MVISRVSSLGVLLACAVSFAGEPAHHHAEKQPMPKQAQSAKPAHGHDHGHAATPPAPAGTNPVKNEMQALTAAMQTILVAISNNQLQEVTPAIHKVHGLKEITSQALKKGEYKPPKNGDKVKAFIKEDDAFHDLLVKLVKASRANDLPAATRATAEVINGCTSCHMKYRF